MNKLVIALVMLMIILAGCSREVFDPQVTQKVTILNQNESYDPLSLIEYDRNAYKAEVEENTLNTAVPKDYSITYIITDARNEKKSVKKTFVFSVSDSVAPVLTHSGGEITIRQGTIFRISDYYQAIDEREGNLTDSITYQGDFSSFADGEYEITVLVSDKFGNEASENVKVIVQKAAAESYIDKITGDYTDISYQSGQAPSLQLRSDGTYTLYINSCTLVNSVQGQYVVADDLLYLTSDQNAFNSSEEYNLALLKIQSDGTLRFSSDIVVCAPSYGDVFTRNQ